MLVQFIPFEYARKEGTIISEETFFSEHGDVPLTSAQKKQLKQNLEVQSVLVMKEFRDDQRIVIKGFCKEFIFIDSETKELYFMPLEIGVKVFFKRLAPIILIYDMKMTA